MFSLLLDGYSLEKKKQRKEKIKSLFVLSFVSAGADVMLWRRKNLTVGILAIMLATWLVFEKSGYTLVSLLSSVLFLLLTILFLWAKSAAIVNR